LASDSICLVTTGRTCACALRGADHRGLRAASSLCPAFPGSPTCSGRNNPLFQWHCSTEGVVSQSNQTFAPWFSLRHTWSARAYGSSLWQTPSVAVCAQSEEVAAVGAAPPGPIALFRRPRLGLRLSKCCTCKQRSTVAWSCTSAQARGQESAGACRAAARPSLRATALVMVGHLLSANPLARPLCRAR